MFVKFYVYCDLNHRSLSWKPFNFFRKFLGNLLSIVLFVTNFLISETKLWESSIRVISRLERHFCYQIVIAGFFRTHGYLVLIFENKPSLWCWILVTSTMLCNDLKCNINENSNFFALFVFSSYLSAVVENNCLSCKILQISGSLLQDNVSSPKILCLDLAISSVFTIQEKCNRITFHHETMKMIAQHKISTIKITIENLNMI